MKWPTGPEAASERLLAFLRDESGQTAIEYGLIVTLVVVAALAGYKAMGGATVNLFNNIGNATAKVF